MGEFITLQAADDRACSAWLARPEGPVRGAVVVLQEIFGVNAHIREVTESFARAGYVALAPAMFDRVQPGVDLGYDAADIQEGVRLKALAEALPPPGPLADVQAAVDHLAQLSEAKVGVIGYCWGGLLTWRAAALVTGLSAAVPYYGGGTTTPAEIARQPLVPVLAHYSDCDPHIPLEGVRELQRTHPQLQVHVYAAEHGFHCNHRPAWNAEASALAEERTLAFLAQHLN